MAFNYPLALTVLARIQRSIDNNDTAWQQNYWGYANSLPPDILINEETGEALGPASCGTAACFAGHALSIAGVKMIWEQGSFGVWYADTDENENPISATARELLGIVEEEDHWDWDLDSPRLFSAENTIDDLYFEVARLAGAEESEVRDAVTRINSSQPNPT